MTSYEEKQQHVLDVFTRARTAVDNGRITNEECSYYLKTQFGSDDIHAVLHVLGQHYGVILPSAEAGKMHDSAVDASTTKTTTSANETVASTQLLDSEKSTTQNALLIEPLSHNSSYKQEGLTQTTKLFEELNQQLDETEAKILSDSSLSARIANALPSTWSIKTIATLSLFVLVMTGLFSVLLFNGGGLTGAVVYEQNIGITYNETAIINITLNQTTRVNVTGHADGQGDVVLTLRTPQGDFKLYEYYYSGAHTLHGSLPKYQYAEYETITYFATMLESAYLITANEAILLDNDTIQGLSAGNYTIRLIINDTATGILNEEELHFVVVPVGTPEPSELFSTCGEACMINITGESYIDVVVQSNATVTIDVITLRSDANQAPQLIAIIPDTANENNASVTLYDKFIDPDGDLLTYDYVHHDGMTEEVVNGVFSVSGTPGTHTYTIYATDGQEITPSNIFTITLLAAGELNTNDTTALNITNTSALNETNTTLLNSTSNTTANSTANSAVNSSADSMSNTTSTSIIGDCSETDPNKRPLECIQGENSSYFKPESIVMSNRNAVTVGSLTPIGNMLIKGRVVEYSTQMATNSDYSMGYEDQNGEFVATVWIDTETGDLHLRGTLTEANGNIPYQDGYSVIANKRGIILAMINRNSGDMVLRGNVIPYRMSLG